MKEYTSEELKKLATESSEKKERLLLRWIDEKLPLMFYLVNKRDIEGRLLYFTRYDFVILMEGKQTASLLAKHAVTLVSRIK